MEIRYRYETVTRATVNDWNMITNLASQYTRTRGPTRSDCHRHRHRPQFDKHRHRRYQYTDSKTLQGRASKG